MTPPTSKRFRSSSPNPLDAAKGDISKIIADALAIGNGTPLPESTSICAHTTVPVVIASEAASAIDEDKQQSVEYTVSIFKTIPKEILKLNLQIDIKGMLKDGLAMGREGFCLVCQKKFANLSHHFNASRTIHKELTQEQRKCLFTIGKAQIFSFHSSRVWDFSTLPTVTNDREMAYADELRALIKAYHIPHTGFEVGGE